MRDDPHCWFQGQGVNDVCFMPTEAETFERDVLASCPELKDAATTECPASEHIQWLRSCVATASSMRPGMLRRDMGSASHDDGGIAGRYTMEGCPGLKIRVEFVPSQDESEPDDVIRSLSKPCLGRRILD